MNPRIDRLRINGVANKGRLWLDKVLHCLFGGHFTIGSRKRGFAIVVYGRNAMHFAINVYCRGKGWLCFRLPFTCFGKWWSMYLYISPDATPQRASFMIGSSD